MTSSVGYSRINLLLDSSFQTFACTAADAGVPNSGCSTQLIPWAVFPGPNNGFTTNFIDIDLFPAHSGNTSAGLFLGPNDPDTFGAELTYTGQLNTIPEKTYLISVFYTLSSVPIPANANLKTPLFIIFLDDGSTVLEVFQTEPFQDNTFFNAVGTAFAEGSDSFTLQGGTGFPHMLFVDDIAMFELF